jgi:hypothetical protein
MERVSTNPWLKGESRQDDVLDDRAVVAVTPVTTAAAVLAPQAAAVPPPDPNDRFPRRRVDAVHALDVTWLVGVHGGAGETTLEQLLNGAGRASSHAWPVTPSEAPPARVLLAARTHASGLRAAQRAATEWAAEVVRVDLVGLVLIADAPGRLPRPLKEFAELVAGGVPRVWRLPWVPAWREGEPVGVATAPKVVRRLLDDLGQAPTPTSAREV